MQTKESKENKMSTTATVESPPPVIDARAANRERFELELEFVQSLANPYYLHSLAQQNILDQPAFVNYLEYLQYWREKDYARFVQLVWSDPFFDTNPNVLEFKATLMLCTIWSCFSMFALGRR
jgi:hypothetical protein